MWVSNSHPQWAAEFASCTLPTRPPRPSVDVGRYLIKWILKMFVSKLKSCSGAIYKWCPMIGLFFWPTYNWFCLNSCNEFYFMMSDFDNITSITTYSIKKLENLHFMIFYPSTGWCICSGTAKSGYCLAGIKDI